MVRMQNEGMKLTIMGRVRMIDLYDTTMLTVVLTCPKNHQEGCLDPEQDLQIHFEDPEMHL